MVKPSRSADHRASQFRNWPLTRGFDGGSKQTRTADPLLVRQVLYQLSYAPGTSSAPVGGLFIPWLQAAHQALHPQVCAIRLAVPFTAPDPKCRLGARIRYWQSRSRRARGVWTPRDLALSIALS